VSRPFNSTPKSAKHAKVVVWILTGVAIYLLCGGRIERGASIAIPSISACVVVAAVISLPLAIIWPTARLPLGNLVGSPIETRVERHRIAYVGRNTGSV
jgi:threonine/homoserine efflux transporter RhtA